MQTVGCLCPALVVVDNILGHPAQHIFIADNYLHARHGGFALGNIFRRSPFVRTDPVVFLNLLGLLLVQENTRQSGIVFDRYGDAVIFRLLHRVLIYDISKYMYGLVDGCSGKAHICGVRQGITQVFGKSVCNFCPYFPGVAFCLYRQFRPEVVLRTVRLVAQTNHIGTLRKQSGGLCEFLNSGNIDPAGLAHTHLFGKFFAGLKYLYSLVFKVAFRAAEQFSALSLQIFPINDNKDCWTTQLLTATQCQLASKEQHGIGLSTPGGAEIGTPLAIAANGAQMGEDMVPQFTRSKELWIAAHHFGRVILFRRIREIDIIAQDFQDAFWRKRSANKGPKRIKPLAGFVFIVDFLPFVEKFEWGVGRSQFVLRPVADNRQCTIFQQGWYIPHITGTNLRMRIAYGGILLGRVFEFDDADRYAVNEKQNVGPTVLTALFHDKLVDATENIMVGMLEVDVL